MTLKIFVFNVVLSSPIPNIQRFGDVMNGKNAFNVRIIHFNKGIACITR
jgi:hypothetical protein